MRKGQQRTARGWASPKRVCEMVPPPRKLYLTSNYRGRRQDTGFGPLDIKKGGECHNF